VRPLPVSLLVVLLSAAGAGASGVRDVERAEALAAAAEGQLVSSPSRALKTSRQALAVTVDFDPTAFVGVGRRGELVEDAYLEARRAYRRHRAGLFGLVGRALAAEGALQQAVRYQRRAVLLDPDPDRRRALAETLVGLGRGAEALAVLLRPDGAPELDAASLELAGRSVDVAGLPSLQEELDAWRLSRVEPSPGLQHRRGPLRLPRRARLSSGTPFQLDAPGLTALYVAEASCRTCSADLEALSRAAGKDLRVVMAPVDPDRDAALRQLMRLYRYDWPMLLRGEVGSALDVPAPSVLLVGRRGWSGVLARDPLDQSLPAAIEVLEREDVQEALPRASWDGRTLAPPPPTPRPGLLEDGLAPGEDLPAPVEFDRAVEAYRAGRFRRALELFDSLEARGDGWLLPPEHRLDRALCLSGMGLGEQARRLLLRTGDSRFQEAVDRALERVGSKGR
jgi:tetratricopeptide (TPR) repeat protein